MPDATPRSESVRLSQSAPFAIRGINVCESLSRHSPEQVQRLLQRLVAWRMNTLVVHPQYGYRLHEPMIRSFCRQHGITLVHYVYTTLAFAADTPAGLFAVDERGQPHRDRMGCETRLCVSSPAALEGFRAGARRYLAERVETNDHVLLATPDGNLLCRCPNCRSMGAAEQWQPLLEVAVDEIARCGKSLTTHFIAYVGRYAPPRDMSVFEQIDTVMFDTHPRYRWAPLGAQHPTDTIERAEAEHDARAAAVPINRYLLDRLSEWRDAFHGKLYVFENLMIQASFSCPQPYTAALLEDQATFRRLGVDGVVYEAFEPGMESFASQFDTLSRAMCGEPVQHEMTRLERLSRAGNEAPMRARPVGWLFAGDEAECLSALREHLPDERVIMLARLLRPFLAEPIWAGWLAIASLALEHRDRFDWIYLAYRLATYLPASQRPTHLSPAEQRLFETRKPWDYLEPEADPLQAAEDLVRTLLAHDEAAATP